MSWYGNKRAGGTLCVAKETSLRHDGDIIVNYIIRGLADLKYSVVIGIFAYAIFLLLMYVRKKRKSLSWKCVVELAF